MTGNQDSIDIATAMPCQTQWTWTIQPESDPYQHHIKIVNSISKSPSRFQSSPTSWNSQSSFHSTPVLLPYCSTEWVAVMLYCKFCWTMEIVFIAPIDGMIAVRVLNGIWFPVECIPCHRINEIWRFLRDIQSDARYIDAFPSNYNEYRIC